MIKGIGILLSYIWLIVSIYLFNWEPFNVFFVYIAEFVIIVLAFTIADFSVNFSVAAQAKRPTQIIFIIGMFFAAFLYIGAGVVVSHVQQDVPFFDNPGALITTGNIFTVCWIALMYLIQLITLYRSHNVHMLLSSNNAFQAIGLTIMVVFAGLGVMIFGDVGAKGVVTIAILGRIGFELYFNKELHIL